jgi:hypothetical protein
MKRRNRPAGADARTQPLGLRKAPWLGSNFLHRLVKRPLLLALLLGEVVAATGVGFAQVSAAEILNPRLKAAEAAYLPQLIALNRSIHAMKFPFPLILTRYVSLNPSSSAPADERGIEFVEFKDQVLLKITGAYSAAFNADQLTQNQRASRVFEDVVGPILQLLPQQLPADIPCDSIGFEITYHVRTQKQSYDYEGYESLVVVFNKMDALGFATLDQATRQQTLNRSQIYVDGKEFGLALAERDPLNVEALERSVPPAAPSSSNEVQTTTTPSHDIRAPWIYRNSPGGLRLPEPEKKVDVAESAASDRPGQLGKAIPEPASPPDATPADAESLQAQYQPQLDAVAKEGTKFHMVDYAPPSFVVFRKQIYLQLTLRNSLQFDQESTSIYKRAAQSFDLFLAPQLKELLGNIPLAKEITLPPSLLPHRKPSNSSVRRNSFANS